MTKSELRGMIREILHEEIEKQYSEDHYSVANQVNENTNEQVEQLSTALDDALAAAKFNDNYNVCIISNSNNNALDLCKQWAKNNNIQIIVIDGKIIDASSLKAELTKSVKPNTVLFIDNYGKLTRKVKLEILPIISERTYNQLFTIANCAYEDALKIPDAEFDHLSFSTTISMPADNKLTEASHLDEHPWMKDVPLFYPDLCIDTSADDELYIKYTYLAGPEDVAEVLGDFITEEDVANTNYNFNQVKADRDVLYSFLDTNFNTLVKKYEEELLDAFETEAIEQVELEAQNEFDYYDFWF